MTHRTVEGSPESKGRITPDAPASPAPPQGEREAFEEMRLTLIGQVHELLDIAERHCWTDDAEEKRRTQGAIDYARKVTAPYNYNGGRASLRASPAVPVAQDERDAFDALVSMCEQHGDFSNGVTDSTGTIDEGEVRASEIIRAARTALSASPKVAQDEREVALDLLALMFDAYEDGPACYEDPEEQAGYLGQAVKLDHDTFHRIADLLNKHRPSAALSAATSPAVSAQARETCLWSRNTDDDSGMYETTCSNAFQFNEGGLADNKVEFCCYCGKPAEEDLWSDDDDAAMGTQPADNKENGK